MVTTVNASTSSGLVQTADTSGIIKLQSNGVTTNALAWVRFDSSSGSSAVITSSYNVSSVTYTSTGQYTVNFTNTLSDANYAVVGSGGATTGTNYGNVYPFAASGGVYTAPTTSSFVVRQIGYTGGASSSAENGKAVMCAVFGN